MSNNIDSANLAYVSYQYNQGLNNNHKANHFRSIDRVGSATNIFPKSEGNNNAVQLIALLSLILELISLLSQSQDKQDPDSDGDGLLDGKATRNASNNAVGSDNSPIIPQGSSGEITNVGNAGEEMPVDAGSSGPVQSGMGVAGAGTDGVTENSIPDGSNSFDTNGSNGDGNPPLLLGTIDTDADTFSIKFGTSKVITPNELLANDSGNGLMVDGYSQPFNGGSTSVDTTNNNVTYTPNPNLSITGGTDAFLYTVKDAGGDLKTELITINILPSIDGTIGNPGSNNMNGVPTPSGASNSPPILVDDTSTVIFPGSPISIDVLANDSDPDGDSLSISNISTPANGVAEIRGGTGTIAYTAISAFPGTDSFTYSATDTFGNTGTATVTVTGNGAPTAINDNRTTNQNQPITIDVLSNDTDPDNDILSLVEDVSEPTNGTAAIHNGVITYTPNPSFTGIDTFNYVIDDSHGHFDTATVTITVI